MVWPLRSMRVLYGFKVLFCLASAQAPARAREVARCTGIPPAQAAKLLYMLTWRGFVSSRRGTKGGFWLRVPASRIRVQDVFEFMYPPAERRGKESRDPVLRAWEETVGDSYQAFLELILADLMQDKTMVRNCKSMGTLEGQWRYFA